MDKQFKDRLVTRARSLPGQILLAVVNATALLAIVAAILAIVIMNRLENFAHSVTTTITSAVITQAGDSPKQALAKIGELADDLRAIRATLKDVTNNGGKKLGAELDSLRVKLTDLKVSIDQLTDNKEALTEEVFSRLARATADMVGKFANCSSASPITFQVEWRDKTEQLTSR